MKKKSLIHKVLAGILCASLIFQNVSVAAFATENDIEEISSSVSTETMADDAVIETEIDIQEVSSIIQTESEIDTNEQITEAQTKNEENTIDPELTESQIEDESTLETDTSEDNTKSEQSTESEIMIQEDSVKSESEIESETNEESEITTEAESATETFVQETIAETEEISVDMQTEGNTIQESLTEENFTKESLTEEEAVQELEMQEVVDSDIQLDLDEGKESALDSGSTNAKWFVFKAPADGYYEFSAKIDKATAYMQLYDSQKQNLVYAKTININTTNNANVVQSLNKDEVIYIKTYTVSTAKPVITLKASNIPFAELAIGDDNTYKAVYGDYIVDINVNSGYKNANAQLGLSADNGAAIDASYKIKYAFIKGSTVVLESEIPLYPSGEKATIQVSDLQMGTEYCLHLQLLDNNGKAIAIISGFGESKSIIFNTKVTDKAIELKTGQITYNSVNIEYESIEDKLKGYYAPIADAKLDLTNKNSFDILLGSHEYTISNLNDNTEYCLWVEDIDGYVVWGDINAAGFKTVPLDITASYELTSGADYIELFADITKYAGVNSNLELYAEYINEAGELCRKTKNISLAGEAGVKTGNGTLRITEGLLAGQEYAITIWLQEIDGTTKYAKSTENINTKEAAITKETIEVSFAKNQTTATSIDYAINVKDNTLKLDGKLYYKLKDEAVWGKYSYKEISIEASETQCTGSIADIQEYMIYDYKLILGGVMLMGEFTLSEPSAIMPDIATNDATQGFVSELTYQFKPSEEMKQSQWRVQAYYKADFDKNYTALDYKKTLDSNNSYTIVVNTGEHTVLKPDTKYQIKWELFKDDVAVHTHYQIVDTNTESSDFIAEVKETGFASAVYNINAVSSDEKLKNTALVLGVYLKKETDSEYSATGKQVKLFGSNGITAELGFIGLEFNTSYNVSLRADGQEYFAFDFKTLSEDNRSLAVGEVLAYLNNAKIPVIFNTTTSEINYVHLYYREAVGEGSSQKLWEHNAAELKNSQTYIFDIKEYNGEPLKENTKYEYKIGIGKSKYTSQANLTHASELLSFTTYIDDRQIKINNIISGLNKAVFEIELTGNAAEGIDNSVYVHYKETGSSQQYKVYGTIKKSGIVEAVCSNLKEDTTYQYEAGIAGSKADIKQTGEFKTLKDDREILVNVKPALNNAVFLLTLKGTAAKESDNHLFVYYKEKADSEADWKSVYKKADSSGEIKLDIYELTKEQLKNETVYEYIAGIGESSTASREKLKPNKVSGEFTIGKDTRVLKNATQDAGYQSVVIEADFTGNTYEEATDIYCLYRKTGETDWKNANIYTFDEKSCKVEYAIENLSQSTEYEYALVISDKNITSPEDITNENHKLQKSFKTKNCGYVLEFVSDEKSSDYNKLVFDVTAQGNVNDEKLYVTLKLNNKNKFLGETILLHVNGYKNKLVIEGLEPDTEYVATMATVSVIENNKKIVISEQNPLKTFKTKASVKVTDISLSKKELVLNAGAIGENRYQTLAAFVTPENASNEVTWTSSDKSVATVRNDGLVYGLKPGTAVIAAKSLYGDVSAECNVTVKNYVIAQAKDGIVQKLSDEQIVIYKGDAISGLGFYEQDSDGNLTLLDGFNVTSQKSQIAVWKNSNELTGNSTGTTEVVFEKNGAKANLRIKVLAKSKAYGILTLETTDSRYPAVKTGDTYEIANGFIAYNVIGEISPKSDFVPNDFNWKSSNEKVVLVENGVISPQSTGEAEIIITPKAESSPYKQKEVKVKLIVKDIPLTDDASVYALTNLKENMMLADVPFPESWGKDWKWQLPQTPLYALPVNSDSYSFGAVYTGKDKYAYQGNLNVYIGTVTDINISETGKKSHNHIIEVSKAADNKDEMILSISPAYIGSIPKASLSYNIPAVDGLDIRSGKNNSEFIITATKAGSYILRPEIKLFAGDKATVIMSGTYEINAVNEAQVSDITFISDVSDIQPINNDDGTKTIKLDLSAGLKNKEFNLTANVTDRLGNAIDTPLEWKITDKSVAAIKYDKASSHKAKIIIKGESGHALIMVSAKDNTGYTANINFEIRDYKPRIDMTKANVNIAYDYETSEGRRLAANAGGLLEIAEVYGEKITDVVIYKENAIDIETRLEAYLYNNGMNYKSYLIKPVNPEMEKGVYNCMLAVKTSANDRVAYSYPIKITVTDNVPTVTVKMTEKLNLFYRTKQGIANINISGKHYGIERIIWQDNSRTAGNGFKIDYKEKVNDNTYKLSVAQNNVKVFNGKPADQNVTSGILSFKLGGIRERISVTFKVNYNYKKPALKTVSSTTSIVPKMGNNINRFMIYDNQSKANIYLNDKEISCLNDKVKIVKSGLYAEYTYTGSKNKENITLTIDTPDWREALNVKHTIKVAEPKAYLSTANMVYNKAYRSELSTHVMLKDVSYDSMNFADIEIKGANNDSQSLVDKDIFEMVQTEENSSQVKVQLNNVKLMGESLSAGNYTFNLTPYYKNVQTGEKTALKPLKLKLKVIDQPVAVKVSPKGTLDLANVVSDLNDNGIRLNAKFANLGDGYRITSARLTGDYSKYFRLSRFEGYYLNSDNYSPNNPYYLNIAQYGKLKAKHNYNLTIEYTITTTSGDEFTVQGSFKVKPKQTAPKVKVVKNNLTMYAASDMSRIYEISVPEKYNISGADGLLDCNKDGMADIKAEIAGADANTAKIKVSILNKNSVIASAKGKTYNLPVTVKVIGRDGISKDAKVTIKVKVKR